MSLHIQFLYYTPVSFKEVGFGHVLPPDSCLDVLGGHATSEQ